MKALVVRTQRPDETWARVLVTTGNTIYTALRKPGVRSFTTATGIRFEVDPDQTIETVNPDEAPLEIQ